MSPDRSRDRQPSVRVTAAVLVASTCLAGEAQRAVARPGPPARTVWNVKTPAWGRPAVDGAAGFFLSVSHEVVAVNLANGLVTWKANTGETGPIVGAGLTLAGTAVIAGDFDVSAYDRHTGQRLWRFAPSTGHVPGTALGQAVDGAVLAGSSAGFVYAIEVASGRPRWATQVGEQRNTIVYEPVAAGDTVFAAFTTLAAPAFGGLVALHAVTGETRWRVEFPRQPDAPLGSGAAGRPMVVDGVVLVATRDGSIRAFHEDAGVAAWVIPGLNHPAIAKSPFQQPSGPAADFRAMASAGRRLFAGSLTGYVTAYSLDTRARLWQHLGAQVGSLGFHLAADQHALYVPSLSGRLTAIDSATGVERWRIGDYQNAFLFEPVVAGDVVYATALGGFYALQR